MKNKYADIFGLSELKKECKQVIKHCEFCDGIIIDHDNVPEEIIVNYDDRQIYSEMLLCDICKSKMCRNCAIPIEDEFEEFYICPDCKEEYDEEIEKIQTLGSKIKKANNKLKKLIRRLRKHGKK